MAQKERHALGRVFLYLVTDFLRSCVTHRIRKAGSAKAFPRLLPILVIFGAGHWQMNCKMRLSPGTLADPLRQTAPLCCSGCKLPENAGNFFGPHIIFIFTRTNPTQLVIKKGDNSFHIIFAIVLVKQKAG